MHNLFKNSLLCNGGKQRIPMGNIWSTTIGSTTINDQISDTSSIFQTGGKWFSMSNWSTWISDDGKSFAKLSISFGRIVYGNGVFVGFSSGAIYSSTDGTNWTIRKSSIVYAGLDFNAGVFIAADKISGLFRSVNGTDWVSVGSSVIGGFSPGSSNWYKSIYFNGVWYVCGFLPKGPSDSAFTQLGIFSSSDGSTWSLVYTSKIPSAVPAFYLVNGLLVLRTVAVAGGRVAATSSNGYSWKETAIAATGIPKVAYGNSGVVAIGSDGYVYDSVDGVIFRTSKISNYPYSGNVNFLASTGATLSYLGGVFFICDGSSMYINSSVNARGDWVLISNSFTYQPSSILYEDGRWFAISRGTCTVIGFSSLPQYDGTEFAQITDSPNVLMWDVSIGATGDNMAGMGARADGLGSCLVCCSIDVASNYFGPPYEVKFSYSEEKK